MFLRGVELGLVMGGRGGGREGSSIYVFGFLWFDGRGSLGDLAVHMGWMRRL